MSPVKCLPIDYGIGNQTSTVLSSTVDAFSFETGTNSTTTTTCPTQPKPRKFFKSRATEDATKNSSNVQNASQISSLADYPSNLGEIHSGANLYSAASGGVGYLSPTYASPSSKIPPKRGRGRPKGTRTTSPRGSTTTTYKPSPARGATSRGRRGRAKTGRSIRGQPSSARGKRKRPQWEGESESEEEEEEEEEAASSELEEPEAPVPEADPEEEEQADEEEGKNGMEEEEEEETQSKEEPKPPIKLRIIRRNDTNAFVSKVGTGPENVQNAKAELVSTIPLTDVSKEEIPKVLDSSNKHVGMPTEQEMPITPELIAKRDSPEHYPSMQVSSCSRFKVFAYYY